MKTFFAKNYIAVIVVVLVAGGAGAYWYVSSSGAPSFSTTTVAKGNVVASVSEPLTVYAEDNANLSFEESGQIAQVNVTEGQTVAQGQVLVSLDASSLNAAMDQANAALAAAQAQYDQLASGTRPEQLQIDETAVTNAQTALSAAVESGYAAADDAIHNQTDNMFSSPNSNNPVFLVPVNDSATANAIPAERLTIGTLLAKWYADLNATGTQPYAVSSDADTTLKQIQSYLDEIALPVNTALPNSTMTPSVLAGYRANIVAARTEITAAVGTLTGAESAYSSAEGALTLAQAGATPQALEAQKAAVLQAQAAASNAQVALGHASLVAPFSGTVQDLTAQVGQVVAPGTPVLSLVNASGLKIDAYASEADVAQIAVGDKANVTLDAFGTGTAFPAVVTAIDNSETQVNGAPAYVVTLHFTNPDSGIKDGMTGNVQITTAEHDNVLEVPSNLVIDNNNQYFVLVPGPKGTTEETPVTIGASNGSTTEITSGLSEGQTIINL